MQQAVRGTTNAFIEVFEHTILPHRKHNNLNYKDNPLNVARKTQHVLERLV